MAAMADWSSLPPVIVRHIGDSLLDTNDLDCYMDFRAVCPKWSSATDDPKNSSGLRFRPSRWVIIDEVVESHSRLMVNTVSGRVVRKDLPLLGNYFVVATTHGGFFVLADKEPPHAAAVLNPFTGHMIRFKAPVPSCVDFSVAALCGLSTGKLSMSYRFPEHGSSQRHRSSPTLVLLWDSCYEQYTAVPDSDCFTLDVEDDMFGICFVSVRLAVASGIFAADGWHRTEMPLPAGIVHKISCLMRRFAVDPEKMFSDEPTTGFSHLPRTVVHANQFFLVESAGEIFAIIKLKKHVKVFRLDNVNGSGEVEPVRSIGGHAIFIGCRRCLSVAADKFPSILANCVYYLRSAEDSSLDIYKYDLEEKKEEMVSEAIAALNPSTLPSANPPFTIVQLLSSYTTNVRESQLLAMERLRGLQLPDGTFLSRVGNWALT